MSAEKLLAARKRLFRPAARVGTLTLQFAPGAAGFGVLPLPSRQFPVAARLSYYSDVTQRATNYVFILLVLLTGILLSLLVNQVLPNQRKRVLIKQRLADLEGRLAGFAGSIDSRLLGLLRLEKKRLRAELRENLPVFPQTSQELPKLEARIDWLVQRVELTSRVGDLLNEMDLNEESLAVPEVDAIRTHCREVLDIVRKSTAATDEIQSAQKHAQLGEEISDRADDEPLPDAIQALRDRATAVLARIPNPLPADSGWTACGDLLTALQKDLPPAGAIGRTRFVRHSRVVRALELIVDFAELVDRSATSDVRARRLERVPEFRAALEPGRDASLVNAQDIVRQIEQNVTKADLLVEMATADTMHVEIDPPTPIAFQLVTFGCDSIDLDSIPRLRKTRSRALGSSTIPRSIAAMPCRRSHPGVGWTPCASGFAANVYDNDIEWLRLPMRALRWLKSTIGRGGTEQPANDRTHTIEARFPALPQIKVLGESDHRANEKLRRGVGTILAAASLSITVLIGSHWLIGRRLGETAGARLVLRRSCSRGLGLRRGHGEDADFEVKRSHLREAIRDIIPSMGGSGTLAFEQAGSPLRQLAHSRDILDLMSEPGSTNVHAIEVEVRPPRD